MSAELHLPDLPDVAVSVGPEPGRPQRQRLNWTERLRMGLGTYLPLLMMVALAGATWWLVKVSPATPQVSQPSAVRHEADYALEHFSTQRYDASGRLAVQIDGDKLRHYPDTDELEIDSVKLVAQAPDGRVTTATARHAVVAGDGSVARLEGDARVQSQGPGSEPPVLLEGQRLVARLKDRQVSTDQPVHVRQGSTEFRADGLDYDDNTRLLQLHGKLRARLQPGRRP